MEKYLPCPALTWSKLKKYVFNKKLLEGLKQIIFTIDEKI